MSGLKLAIVFALAVTGICAIVPALQKWTLLVGGTLFVILLLRYERTKGTQ